MEIMKLNNITKIYNSDDSNEVVALKDVSVSFELGKLYAIMGPSGSGKTTLINILGLLDDATSGEYIFENKKSDELNEIEKANIRNSKIGFVFQTFYLDNNLTAYENVLLPVLKNNNLTREEKKDKVEKLLDKFNLLNRKNHYPNELSGGECQRIAIARALINDPLIIIADEPTGNLDEENEKLIFNYLKDISKSGKCVIVVSHNKDIKKYCDNLYEINGGKLS
ncbi:MAG: ABC transporter ATP-binding protein [Bacilli bacterium]|nr:ABC transporter ATP-binding protein [Bacilli bacterium]